MNLPNGEDMGSFVSHTDTENSRSGISTELLAAIASNEHERWLGLFEQIAVILR
jgi:hypothetical protein